MKQKQGMNRRSFLKRTAGAAAGMAAFPYIVPASALGRDGAVAPSNRVTIGCIGLGGMGNSNLDGFLNDARAQVVAICDVDTQHRNAARDKVNAKYGNGDCAVYTDFREVIARADIDALSNALPDHWHAIPAIMGARAGKDIYSEKPLAYSIAEGRAICDATARYGTIWQTGSWQRSQDHFRFACELVRNGCIGQVHTVRVGLPSGNGIREGATAPCDPPEGFDYDMWLGPAPYAPYCPVRCHWNFRWISDYAGGQLTDWAGHHCDIAQWGMGTERTAPVSIEGKGVWPEAENGLFDTPDDYHFACRFPRDVSPVSPKGFTMIVSSKQRMGAFFEGEKGHVFVTRGAIEASPESLLKLKLGPNDIHLCESRNHIGNFLDCVASRNETSTPAEVAHHSIMIGHLGMIAMKLARKVHWDPEKECFPDDPEANRLLSRAMRDPWYL
jgi:predicted dehydrogenase